MFIKEEEEKKNNYEKKYSLDSLPSLTEMGLTASKKGNFNIARRLLNTAMQQLREQSDKQSELIDLMVNIGDTYFNEGSADLAKLWYGKALDNCQHWQNKNNSQLAIILCKLAELHVLTDEIEEGNKCFCLY